MYPSLYDGGTCSLLKPQLSTVHHRVKDSQASRINILTAVLDIRNNECALVTPRAYKPLVTLSLYVAMYLSSLIHNY